MAAPLIIGDSSDRHVAAVVNVLAEYGVEPVLLDAPRLQVSSYSVDLSGISIDGRTASFTETRGWLRRYAPDAWGHGELTGSVEAVQRHAFLRLIGSISRLAREWLTPLDALLAAEDRLLQLAVARQLGIGTPRTLITTNAFQAHKRLGPSFVAKPLAGGWFWTEENEPRAVFAQEVNEALTRHLDFSSAPFVLQDVIPADRHLRVVTVRDKGMIAALDALDRPLDWRSDISAHHEWHPTSVDEVVKAGVSLAERLGVGFSSQDWVESGGEYYFLDMNPAGQWLFLPDEVSDPATRGIANYLLGRDE